LSIAGVKKQPKMHIGTRIKRLRAFKGLNQEDLAQAIGKTRSLISHLEKTGNVNRYTLLEIAQALQTTVEELEQMELEPSSKAVDASKIIGKPISKTAQGVGLFAEDMISQQKKEIEFLKETIQNQWKVIHDLTVSTSKTARK
jgi:transcriptional regulator with XRE-family HTH domain